MLENNICSNVNLRELAERVRAAREGLGLTIGEMCQRTGLSPRAYGDLEAGAACPSLGALDPIRDLCADGELAFSIPFTLRGEGGRLDMENRQDKLTTFMHRGRTSTHTKHRSQTQRVR